MEVDGSSEAVTHTMSVFSSALEPYDSQLFRIALVLILPLLSYLCIVTTWRRRKLPPGPTGIPVLGYLPFLSASEPHIQLEAFRKKYGNIFGMYLGSRLAVFLGDLSTSKDAYNLDVFSGRPEGAFPISKRSTHFAALNGQPWKNRRKLTSKALRHLGVGTQTVQNVAREQIDLALNRLEEELSSSPNCEINVRSVLTQATTSVILYFVCGKTFPLEHPSYKTVERFLKYFAENGAGLSLDICLPWVKPVLDCLTSFRKTSSRIFDDMEEFVRSEIQFHRDNPTDSPKDLIDFYLQHYEKENTDELPISDISGDAQVMIFGGADTVRGTAEWFLLCMAKYQAVQEKVFQEIDSVIGSTGDIRYEDKDKLPYTEATIYESMRFKTLLPLNPYHSCLQDTKFRGYDIPEGSLVFAMLSSIHDDPVHWAHPDKFHPEHFLTADESSVKIPEAFLPFSPGKRTCPGDKLAMIETHLLCVSLVRRFKILPPDSGLNMEGNLRLNMEPAQPTVKLVKRQH